MSDPKKLIILDRDGVINHDSPEYIKAPDECHFIDGSIEAIATLHKAGFLVAIATNQAGIGRGLYTEETLAKIHEKIVAAVEKEDGRIDAIFYCPHHPDDHCDCRKPKPGLLHQIEKHFGINLNDTCLIGDSWRDIKAAITVGTKAILVKTGNGEKTLEADHDLTGVVICDNLADAVNWIITKGIA